MGSHIRIISLVILCLLPLAGYSQTALVQKADSLNRLGMSFYEQGQYRQAERYLQKAYHLYRENTTPSSWLGPGIDYAEILVDRSKYNSSLALFKELRKVAAGLEKVPAQARIENDLGWLYLLTGNNEAALNHLKQAIPLARQAKDTLRLGYIYNNIGSIYFSRGDHQTALKYRKQSLIYKKQAGDPQSISITLNNIALSYKKLLLYDKAIEYYNRSLQIRKELGNADLLAGSYSNVGALYKEVGNYDQALVSYQKSLQLRKKAGNPSGSATTLNNIAALYDELGQTERALDYYMESLQLKQQYANDASLAITYRNIAGRLWNDGRSNKALDYYNKALSLHRQVGNPHQIANTLLSLVAVHRQAGAMNEACRYIREAEAIADSTRDPQLLHRAALEHGALSSARGHLAKAIGFYRESLAYSRSLEKDAALAPLKNLAYSYHNRGSDSTLYFGRKAVAIVEAARRQTGSLSRLKRNYFKRHVDFYVDMAGWVLHYKDDVAEAFRFAELAKARALSEELVQAARRVDESLPESKRIDRAQQLARISTLYERLNRAGAKTDSMQIKQQIREAELAYAAFENRLQRTYPRYKNITSPEPISLKEARNLCGDGTAVLHYTLNEERLLIFLISRRGVNTHQWVYGSEESNEKELLVQARAFRQAIIRRVREDSLEQLSAPLYDRLIGPLEAELEGFDNLLISPDRALAYIPFEALKKEDNYLVSSFNIKYTPSLTGYMLISEPTRYDAPLLAIGNAARYAAQRNMPQLPTLEQEIASISNLFTASTTMAESSVTEAAVKRQMQKGYDYIHIAAHSIIDERNSSLSGILLNTEKKKPGIGNDGFLRSTEIYSMNIPARMVVLSACESGIGHLVDGEGMLGLQRAFFSAGVSSVVVSLWDVYDRPTTHFMQQFYRTLKAKREGGSWSESWNILLRWIGWNPSLPYGLIAASMRDTKRAMLEHPEYRHPVFWAPFIVVGR